MALTNEKTEKLVKIAKLYYEYGRNQNQIAEELGISRPLVSRYLTEAKDYGVVKIQISSPVEERKIILDELEKLYGIRGGVVVDTRTNVVDTNDDIAEVAINHLKELGGMQIGIGWGTIIGAIAAKLEKSQTMELNTRICPLVGNSGVFNRDYHSNEIVRIFAEKTGGTPNYWYAPAFVDSPDEARRLKELDNYKEIQNRWKSMKVVLANIGNYPSVPDFATAANYGTKLTDQKAVGKLLCYYYDKQGHIIKPNMDCTLQIPLEILAKRKTVIGVCAANVNANALAGALKTGIFTHIIASKDILTETIELSKQNRHF